MKDGFIRSTDFLSMVSSMSVMLSSYVTWILGFRFRFKKNVVFSGFFFYDFSA
jgi:hypothetical protein